MTSGSGFLVACSKLLEAHEGFKERRLSSVDHAFHREKSIADAMTALAAEHGVRLQGMRIRNGEFMVVALREGESHAQYGTDRFGDFAELLNRYGPRTGTLPGAVLQPESGWCYLNHFSAECLILDAYERQLAMAEAPAAAAPSPRGG